MHTTHPQDLVGRVLTFYLPDSHRIRGRVLAYLPDYFTHSACYVLRVTNVTGVKSEESSEPEIYLPASQITMFTEIDFPRFPGEAS